MTRVSVTRDHDARDDVRRRATTTDDDDGVVRGGDDHGRGHAARGMHASDARGAALSARDAES